MKKIRSKSLIKFLFLLLLSSTLYNISFPGLSLWPFIFIALIPFFYSIENSGSYRNAFLSGAAWMIFAATLMVYWVSSAIIGEYEKSIFLSAAFFLITILIPLGLVTGGFGMIYYYFFNNNKNLFVFRILTLPSLWILFEYMREFIPLFVPWGNIGYSLFYFNTFIQSLDLWGIYGISFLVVMVNSLLYEFIITGMKSYNESGYSLKFIYLSLFSVRYKLILIMVIFLFSSIYGSYRINNNNFKSGEKLNVTIVQGSFNAKERWSGTAIDFYTRIEKYLKLSKNDSENKPEEKNLIIWPETVLNNSKEVNDKLFAKIYNILGENSNLLTGGVRFKKDLLYNSAYLIDKEGIKWYDKNILLPYAEFSPLKNSFLGKIYDAPTEFNTGSNDPLLVSSSGRMGIFICFEILYPWYVRNSVTNGAEFLVNVSNDTWFGDSAMPETHLISSAYRAIENRRFLLRASNSGISAIINSKGIIEKKLDLFIQGRLMGEFYLNKEITLYASYGDWILYFSIIILSIMLILSAYKD